MVDPIDSERVEQAMRSAATCYRACSRGVQGYVRGKLAWDPVYRQLAMLAPLPQPVLDLGCGNGQMLVLLAMLQPGLAATGVDWDEHKLGPARAATGELASVRIEHGDLRDRPIERAGTILLIDVLHYLEPEDQDAVLRRAVKALDAGGRLYIRDVDRVASGRSWINRLQEGVARALGLHKGRGLHFRPSAELIDVLTSLGTQTSIAPSWGKLPLSNRLIEARIGAGDRAA